MEVSGRMLNIVFDQLPRGSHVDLVLETPEARETVKACADIIVQGHDQAVYC
jgi:hypothetical protein